MAYARFAQGPAEEETRQRLLKQIVDKTGLYAATGLDEKKGEAELTDISRHADRWQLACHA